MGLNFEGPGMQNLNTPTNRTQRVDEQNEVICVDIMFTPGVVVIKMSKMAHFCSKQMLLWQIVFPELENPGNIGNWYVKKCRKVQGKIISFLLNQGNWRILGVMCYIIATTYAGLSFVVVPHFTLLT